MRTALFLPVPIITVDFSPSLRIIKVGISLLLLLYKEVYNCVTKYVCR